MALFEGLCDIQQLVYAGYLLISFVIIIIGRAGAGAPLVA